MEYASGGELFERICNAGRFSEDEVCFYQYVNGFFGVFFCTYAEKNVFSLQARFFFQQLISGVSYCHSMVLYV